MGKTTEKNIKKLADVFPQIQRFFHNVSIEVSKTGEFTIAQYRVLSLLEHFGTMTVNDIKKHLNIAQSSASGLAERLEQLDLVKRGSGLKDKRVTELSLTSKARRIISKKAKSMDDVYRDIMAPLSGRDQELMVKSFENLLLLIDKIEAAQK